MTTTSRRDFIRQSFLGASAATLLPHTWSKAQAPGIALRPMGRTGADISMLGLGGHHIGQIKEDQESISLIREAVDLGVTFFDNAWEYHDGRSEDLMGRALRDGYRDKVFLMTKHHGRERKVAMQHLEDSLKRLQTDVIDLWQFHEVVYPADPGMIEKQGALEFAEEARKQGKIRFVGFTGHKDPAILRDMLALDFKWDAVQMPVNVLDPHYKSFIREILPVLQERGIGALAMKTMASGNLLRTNAITPEEALRFAWSQPVATVISGMATRDILRQNAALAAAFTPMPEAEQTALLAKSEPFAVSGEYEPFKSTNNFDGPVGRKLHGVA